MSHEATNPDSKGERKNTSFLLLGEWHDVCMGKKLVNIMETIYHKLGKENTEKCLRGLGKQGLQQDTKNTKKIRKK